MLRFDFVMTGRKEEHPLHKMAAQLGWAGLAARIPETFLAEEPMAMAEVVVAAKRQERPVLEVAFSMFKAGSGELSRSKIRVMAVLYRSWRRPLKVEYTTISEGA